jgi:hypothetical protein
MRNECDPECMINESWGGASERARERERGREREREREGQGARADSEKPTIRFRPSFVTKFAAVLFGCQF